MQKRSFKDQLGRSISINFPPKRIISLVPSQTELLFDLGLNDEIIGVTRFCNHPAGKVKSKVKIGGTKALNLQLIRSLQPDVIIANKEENNQQQIEILMHEFPVWISDISNLEHALDMIGSVGELVNRGNKALQLSMQISQLFKALPKLSNTLNVAYIIWQKPLMAAGKNTYIDDMLTRFGLVNLFEASRYPEIKPEDLRQADLIMLSSEPYPFKEEHLLAFQSQYPDSKVILVDGEMFSWYGSRMLKAVPYFDQLITTLI